MNDQVIDRQASGGNGQKVARRAAALVLALVIAGVLDVGIGLAYGVPEEYGMFESGDTMADIVQYALVLGAILGLITAGLLIAVLRLLDRRRPRGIVLAAVVLVIAAAMGGAGAAGRHSHDVRAVQTSTTFTPVRIAVSTEIAPPS